MINEETALIRCIRLISEIFGIDYVRNHKEAPIVQCIDGDIFSMSYLFEDGKQRPDLIPDHFGWTVYATVSVNMNTGEATMLDYVLPDGTRMDK